MHEAEGDAVVVLGDLDMVIEVDPAALPLGILVGFGRQGAPVPPVELVKQLAPAASPAAHRPVVEIIEQCADRRIKVGQREEAPVPQPRQNPAPDDLDADLDFRFVARTIRPRRDDGGTVMPRHVGIGPVDHRLVNEALVMPAFRLSLTVCRAAPPKKAKARTCEAIQSGKLWLHTRLGVGEARGAEHGDEDLHRGISPVVRIDHLGGAAGEIDEQLLAGDVDLTQCRLKASRPFLVAFAEPRIAKAVGVGVAVLLPKTDISVTPARRCSRWTSAQSGCGRSLLGKSDGGG